MDDDDFFVVDFFVLLMLDFLAGAVVLAAVVVSFWLAQEETKKPTATKAVIVQISECFIGLRVNERQNVETPRSVQALVLRENGRVYPLAKSSEVRTSRSTRFPLASASTISCTSAIVTRP